MSERSYYTIPLCLTHRCNLNCIYCFEKHDAKHEMSYETAIDCVQRVLKSTEMDSTIEFIFFGGEPLLRFDLIKNIVNYILSLNTKQRCRFFASTNGVLLTSEMKEWFEEHKEIFVLGLSLDGTPDSHNYNRSNSYDKIDILYFKNTWLTQNVKMTVSEATIANYANDVLHIHSLGFGINGGDVCLGNTGWQNKDLLKVFGKQLMLLIDYYSNPEKALYNALLDIDLSRCAAKNIIMLKQCGVGDKLLFFDTDGKQYPCTYMTPMTFDVNDIEIIQKTNFKDPNEFIDSSCAADCYLYPICKRCPAENYLHNHSFKLWNKDKCGFTEVIALIVSEIEARKIINNPKIYDETKTYYTIEAIKKIRELYYPKYKGIVNFE